MLYLLCFRNGLFSTYNSRRKVGTITSQVPGIGQMDISKSCSKAYKLVTVYHTLCITNILQHPLSAVFCVADNNKIAILKRCSNGE